MIMPLATGAQVAFWMLAPVMILGAIGMIAARKPVHSALCLAAVMISLAVQYAAQEAPFLFAVQIIVYTGAILMLFLFVLMLVGVDAADSMVETIKGQRPLAVLAGIGFGSLLVFAVGNALVADPIGLDFANREEDGNTQGIAKLVFNRYVFAFEATSALLITAAVGAMVLAHRERLVKRKTQGISRRSGCAATPRPANTLVRCRLRASSRDTMPWTPRRCCPTAPRRRSRCRRPCGPAARSWTRGTLSGRSTRRWRRSRHPEEEAP